MTAQTLAADRTGRRLGPVAAALLRQFPPRRPESSWSATEQSREEVSARLLAPPFVLDVPGTQARRRAGIGKILRWLEHIPGKPGRTGGWSAAPTRPATSPGDTAHRVAAARRQAYARQKNDFDALGSAILR